MEIEGLPETDSVRTETGNRVKYRDANSGGHGAQAWRVAAADQQGGRGAERSAWPAAISKTKKLAARRKQEQKETRSGGLGKFTGRGHAS